MSRSDAPAALEQIVRSTGEAEDYGITDAGFVPKTAGRLLEEKVAAARVLLGPEVDLTAGSTVRKILEMMCLEETRLWQHLHRQYDSTFVSSATGDALTLLGQELGLDRPHLRASGTVTIELVEDLPDDVSTLRLERGTRLTCPGGSDYFIDDAVQLSANATSQDVRVVAFDRGPDHNLDPAAEEDGVNVQKLNALHPLDPRSSHVRDLEARIGAPPLGIKHEQQTTGGELLIDDETYRSYLLAYPRNLWSPQTLQKRLSVVPGVRQLRVKDKFGGLDINQSIFGNFNFIERLFSEERSLGSPYFITVLVAMDEGAIWEGRGQLRERLQDQLDEIRPLGIFPSLELAGSINVKVSCRIRADSLAIETGASGSIEDAPEVLALKGRILDRIRQYVERLDIGEEVLYSEVLWSIMEEPDVGDCRDLVIQRYPPLLQQAKPEAKATPHDVSIGPTEIAELTEEPALITLI